jgi:hypothetical protein
MEEFPLSSTCYTLTGDGITLSLLSVMSDDRSQDGPTLTVELNNSFAPWLNGHSYKLSGSDLTIASPTEDAVKVSGLLRKDIVTRHPKVDVRTLGIDLFVPVPTDPAAQVVASAAAVLIDYASWPPAFHEVTMTGTLSTTP